MDSVIWVDEIASKTLVSRAGTGTRVSFRIHRQKTEDHTSGYGSFWVSVRAPNRFLGRSLGRQDQLQSMVVGARINHRAASGPTAGSEVCRPASRATDRCAFCQIPGWTGPLLDHD